jgi:hypothetical protein
VYIEARQAAGIQRPDYVEYFWQDPFVIHMLKYFSTSKLVTWNHAANEFVFSELCLQDESEVGDT